MELADPVEQLFFIRENGSVPFGADLPTCTSSNEQGIDAGSGTKRGRRPIRMG